MAVAAEAIPTVAEGGVQNFAQGFGLNEVSGIAAQNSHSPS